MSKALAMLAAFTLSASLTIGIAAPVAAAGPMCGNTSTGNRALTDLGTGTFQGEQGGLYPGGSNIPPAAYQAAGIQAAKSIAPLDRSGRVGSNGSIVFLSIGMSNASMEFSFFASAESQDTKRNSQVAIVDGAQGGQPAVRWTSSSSSTWAVVDQRLAAAGFTDQQVQVVWLKEADVVSATRPSFETYGRTLASELTQITSIAAQRYPNLRQLFVSARSYGGYSGIYPSTSLNGANPEPWAYETGFAVKWFVAQWVTNPAQRPWVGWGPYFWTDGTRGRADGLTWQCTDVTDGEHPSVSGRAKVDAYMSSLFLNSSVTPWFRSSAYVPAPSPNPSPVATPVATPGATPGATPSGAAHSPTARSGATQQPISSTATNPSPTRAIVGTISAAMATVSKLPPPERWSLVAVAILLIGGCLTAFAMLVMGRRLRPPFHPRAKPVSGGPSNGSGPSPGLATEVSEPPALVGAGSGTRGSEETGPPPAR
jgi:hypothetical protein